MAATQMADEELVARHLEDVGVTVREGELATFPTYNTLQRLVLPIFGKVGQRMVGLGSAVCVAPGLFVTARHVIADLDDDIPAQWIVPYDRLWVYLETDQAPESQPDAIYGGLLEVLFANPHSETDLATLTVDMVGNSADWIVPAVLRARMPELGEQIDCFGYDLASVEGHLGAEVTLILNRRLSVSTGRVTGQQPVRRPDGHHRTSPGFTTSAATPRGMSGGPVFDQNNEVIGFNSGAHQISTDPPLWNSFVSGVASALELNFVKSVPHGHPDGSDPDVADSIEDRTEQFAHLVAEDRIVCHLHPTFHVNPTTREAGYVLPSALKAEDEN